MFSTTISRQLSNRSRSFGKYIAVKNSTKTNSKSNLKHYAKGTFLSIIFGACVYDGYNEFKICGSVSRFIRSLKIAATISVDYTWSLYGLENGTEEYKEVSG